MVGLRSIERIKDAVEAARTMRDLHGMKNDDPGALFNLGVHSTCLALQRGEKAIEELVQGIATRTQSQCNEHAAKMRDLIE